MMHSEPGPGQPYNVPPGPPTGQVSINYQSKSLTVCSFLFVRPSLVCLCNAPNAGPVLTSVIYLMYCTVLR